MHIKCKEKSLYVLFFKKMFSLAVPFTVINPQKKCPKSPSQNKSTLIFHRVNISAGFVKMGQRFS